MAPDRERSWVGKAITRFEPLHVEVVTRNGVEMHAVTGFPADCVQLGVHTLFPEPPALVVSGINAGFNHGTAFLGGSGTVGAALEAGIAGISGLALSTGTHQRPWGEWREWADTPQSEPMWERLAGVAVDLAAAVLSAGDGHVLSVNIPEDADLATPRRETTVAPVGYGQLFHPTGDGHFEHRWGDGLRPHGPLAGSDLEAAGDGVISVTLLESVTAAALPAALGKALRLDGARP